MANYTVSEGAGSVQYHLVFLGWLEREITIFISTVEGSAERELSKFQLWFHWSIISFLAVGQDYEEQENTTIVLSV